MIVKYSIFGYLIGEGFRNFFKNKKSTAASLIIMCATMFIFGIFFLIGENVNYIMQQVQDVQEMNVFINPEATKEVMRRTTDRTNIFKDTFVFMAI